MTKQEEKDRLINQMYIRENILWNIAVNFNYTKHLYTVSSSTNVNTHCGHIQFNLFKVLVIDLAKLFVSGKNQKFNLFNLLDDLETGELKELGLKKSQIEHYRKQLALNSSLFTSTKHFRDTLFAHTDYLGGIGPTQSFFTQLEGLITLSYELLNEISISITGQKIHNVLNKTDLTNFKIQ